MTRLRIYLTLALALLFALACALPELPMDDATFNTAVAQTVMVGLTEKYESPTPTASPTMTLTPSFTPSPLPETPTLPPSLTPTEPPAPTVTNTLEIPQQKIIVVVNTNCRTGPDASFRVEGTLMKGESTTVHGIDPTGRFFYIRNPDPGLEYCWMSGKHATVGGSTAMLPVLTAMPTATATFTATPVPGFNAAFFKLEECGSWWVDLELTNGGAVAFKSVLIKIKEPFKGETYTTGGNEFLNRDGCSKSPTKVATLEPGSSVLVSTASVPYNIHDKQVVITVTVCTELDGNGTCLTKTLTFKPRE